MIWNRQNKMQAAMYFQLRADIHNSSENLNRTDKRRWKAQDFGADPVKEEARPYVTREQLRTRMMMQHGAAVMGSTVANLKGQELPPDIQARIDAGKTQPKRRYKPLPVARGQPVNQ